MTRTLWDFVKGESGIVKGFKESLEESYCLRLMELGFHPGEQVTCVQSPNLGAPRLYRVHNTIYSLEDQIASLVLTTGVE